MSPDGTASEDTGAGIVIVSKRRGNARVISEALAQRGYMARAVSSEVDLLALIDGEPPPQLVLLEIAGFEPQIWQWCESLRTREVPFIVISARSSTEDAVTGKQAGATTVLNKPIQKSAMLALVDEILGRGSSEP